MDFYSISTKTRKDVVESIYPSFKITRTKDLMIRGGAFYAIWDEERGIWSTDEADVARLVDKELHEYQQKHYPEASIRVLSNFSTGAWKDFNSYVNQMFDTFHQLDEKLTFSNTEIKRSDYVSKRLPYPLEAGSCSAYEELMSTLYEPDERAKLEWAIGSIIAGDSKDIQKFIVLYGEAGSGKSTVLNIIEKLFVGYHIPFEAKGLVSSNNTFALEMFRTDPLVAIQHDGDLSRIEDNTKLNSIVSHETMMVTEKYKSPYPSKTNCFLFMATNKPVKITDGKSGIIRRLIDVSPSGRRVPPKTYDALIQQIDFELGAIAHHCLQVYLSMGKNYYLRYRSLEMMFKTDAFFNFVEDSYYIFKKEDGIGVSQAYAMYKEYCEKSAVEYKLPLYKFREELKNYFKEFSDRTRVDGVQLRSYYSGFLFEKFNSSFIEPNVPPSSLVLDQTVSLFDEVCKDCPAQYASENETPLHKWETVTSTLEELETGRIHYVKVPENHIVIDFDIKDENGEKSLELNLEAASKWPPTYGEYSKSERGIHLHYIYDGDVSALSRVYSEGVEVKVFSGGSSLRRKLTKCNAVPIATINSGLPLKGEKVVNFESIKSEKSLRVQIERNLRKEIHPGTKPSIDFIYKILDDAYKSGLSYDVTDMRPRILTFANNSTNQAEYCVKLVQKMSFASEEPSETPEAYQSDELIFFDVEVFPNLFVVVWKAESKAPVKMINPGPRDIEELLKFKLVGFNNRRYDNHILYARYIGYSLEELYGLSQKIVNGSRNALFGEAYNLSYTDVYDFSSKKQSLKKFQIELGIHHQELGLPWDEPVPEELWEKVADYCVNDVTSLQETFEARRQDFIARLILSDLSKLTPNDTTQMHTAKIIFGNDKKPQDKFVYTDLSELFPGYVFDAGKSIYRGEETGEGGYVYSEPGMYSNVAVLDVASMHPNSAINLNIFGPYTKNFKELVDARIAIKHKDYEAARNMLGGILTNYLTNDDDSGALAYALKIVINIVYGLTSAKFENKFKDPRNKDNIVAKRGALFMIDLKHAVQEKGFKVVHIKTDSIKIPDATQEIIDFVCDFGTKYGYTFEHEETYERFCLVNDAVYIARSQREHKTPWGTLSKWTGTGTQFNPESNPYVFKTLFSNEPIAFTDMVETKSVTSALYLDMNEKLGEDEHDYHFVGKVGAFCPVLPDSGGGLLCREKDGKYYAATGSKGFRWLEAEMVKSLELEHLINRGYYNDLVDAAVHDISQYGDFEWFVSDAALAA